MRTAYEMRSSDWSSDVCSSDLWHLHLQPGQRQQPDVGGAERIRRQCLVSLERGVALVGHADLALPVLIQTFDSSNANGRGNPARSDERRVGKVCVSTFRSRWSPSH